ncbi:MAG TPA: hypothetical protein VK576_01105, partial [Thermoleophilia bacterium]|nr:hypothetical protein [Thermoleophilia bacterium]
MIVAETAPAEALLERSGSPVSDEALAEATSDEAVSPARRRRRGRRGRGGAGPNAVDAEAPATTDQAAAVEQAAPAERPSIAPAPADVGSDDAIATPADDVVASI